MKHWIRIFTGTLLLALLICCLSACSMPGADTGAPEETKKPGGLFAPEPTEPPILLGGAEIAPDAQELTLNAGTFTLQELQEARERLPQLTRLSLPETDLTLREIQKLRRSGLTVDYTVTLAGQTVPGDAKELDLSALKPKDLTQTAEKLTMLPALTDVELMSAAGKSSLSKQDVRTLMDAAPAARFHYEFDLFGQHLSTLDTRVVYDSVEIGNEGVPEVREAMDIMTDCEYFLLDSCGIDNEHMAQLRDEHPEMKVVWRVFFKDCNLRTDAHVVRVTFELNDSNCTPLKYCTEAVYVDLGHNDKMTDCSYLAYMPNLECIILSGAAIKDITPFANSKNLIWVELVFCVRIESIEVFRDHPTMKYLNISRTYISDISMLDNVPLERFNCMAPVSQYAQRHFKETHPNCIAVYYGVQPYGYGWRYNDSGYTFFDYYQHMRDVFHYDETEYFGSHKGVHEDDEIV